MTRRSHAFPEDPRPGHAMSSPARPVSLCAAAETPAPFLLVASAWLGLLGCPAVALAQDRRSPLRLEGIEPAGARGFATESWGTYKVTLTNGGDTDRRARVFVSHNGQPDVQYGRDV